MLYFCILVLGVKLSRVSRAMRFYAWLRLRIFCFLRGIYMENELYKNMYYHLFNAVTDAIRSETKEEADVILKRAQITTEDMYVIGEE